jgi:hypothetical protein
MTDKEKGEEVSTEDVPRKPAHGADSQADAQSADTGGPGDEASGATHDPLDGGDEESGG